MYSFGTSFLTSPQGLLSSITPEALASSSVIFASPLTIDLKQICACCENSYDFTTGHSKTREMKQVEEIALEHFKRRVLKVKEESLVDASISFPNDLDGSRYKKVLGSIALCNECVSRFVKVEQEMLQDQVKYLEKMSGVKKMEDVFNDPWLDVKRLVFPGLKSQEPAIREKLELLEKFSASGGEAFMNVICGTSTALTPGPSSSTPQQILVTTATVNFPSGSAGGVPVNVEVCGVEGQQKQLEPVTLSFADPNEKTCLPSSNIGSPTQDKDNESSNDGDARTDDTTITDENSPKGKAVPEPKDNEEDQGHVSEAESVQSVRNHIPPNHLSPVVRLQPLSVIKTPTSSSRVDRASSESRTEATSKVAKKLNLDEVEDLLNDSNESDGIPFHEIQDTAGTGVNSEDNSSQKENDGGGDSQADKVVDVEEGDPPKAMKKKKRGQPRKEDSQSQEDSNDDISDKLPTSEDDSDNGEDFIQPSSSGKVKKRKRSQRRSAGQKKKKYTVKFDFPKIAKLSQEKELELTAFSDVKPSSAAKSQKKSKLDSLTTPTKNDSSSSQNKNENKGASSENSVFSTPTAPAKKSGSKAMSVADFVRDTIGIGKKAPGSPRTSTPAKDPSATPSQEDGNKVKKYFRIGNRYMTEESSSDDDSDEDPSFVAPTSFVSVIHSESD